MARTFKLFLDTARNNEQRVIPGNFLKIIEASNDEVRVNVSFDVAASTDSTYLLGDQAEVLARFTSLYITHDAQPGGWVRILVSEGDETVNYPKAVSLSGSIDGIINTVKVQTGGTNGQNFTVTGVGTMAVKLLDARPTRTSFALFNDSGSQVLLYGYNSGVTSGNGMKVGPQVYQADDWTGEVWGITAGSSTNVRVTEAWR